jgi:uncharacterized membrane protein
MRSPRAPHNLVILAGYGLGAAALSVGLPEQIPPFPTGSSGDAAPFGALMVAFLLPTAVALTDVMLRDLCMNYPMQEAGSRDVLPIYDAIMLRFALFVMGVHATVLFGLLGLLSGRDWAGQIVPVMLGLAMISIGNLLPRTRPNLALGIRTRRTLSDRALWIRTHRSTGYLVVALGFVIVLSAIAVPAPIGRTMVLAVGPAGLLGTCFLVRYSRKHGDDDR